MALPLEQIDIETVTLGELAKIYTREQELKSPLGLGALLSKYADTPAIQVFQEGEDGSSIAKQVMRQAQGSASDSAQKGALKTLRYLSNRLYNAYDSNPPDFLISNEKNTPQAAQQFFGTKEPKKAVSTLQVSVTPAKRKAFIKEIIKYGAANPDKMPEVRAIMFGLNTGLRPNANLGLSPGNYIPESGALYISAKETGAKGRAISIPLNSVADSMIQQQLAQFGPRIKEVGSIFINSEGQPIKTSDVNAILSEIKVPNILYDAATEKWYDTFKPEGGESSKFGMSLFRNFHATLGRNELGIDPPMMGKLQGRSQSSLAKGPGVGELFTYVSTIPGEVSEYERTKANLIGGAIAEGIEEAKKEIRVLRPDFTFDYGADTDKVTTRITEATEGFGSDYFKREIAEVTEAPKIDPTASEKASGTPLTDAENKDFLDRLTKFGTKGLKALPLVGVGIAAGAKKAEAEEMIEAGEAEMPAYLRKGAEFLAEEATPYGFVPPVEAAIGAGLEAGAEAMQEEAEEKGIAGDIEAQFRGMFGIPPQQ